MTANDPHRSDDSFGRRHPHPHDGPGRNAPGHNAPGHNGPHGDPVEAEIVMAGGADDVIRSAEDVAYLNRPPHVYGRPVRRRRVMLPIVLFVASCVSTFWVGTTFLVEKPILVAAESAGEAAVNAAIAADPQIAGDEAAKATVREQASFAYLFEHNYPSGLTYMAAVIGILLCHEMGHFLQTLRHRIPASLPFFIPMPIGPIGTMGAVIGMDGSRANRRELFDIGITGPLAGLIVAIPITWIGIQQAEAIPLGPNGEVVVSNKRETEPIFHAPWMLGVMIEHIRPELQPGQGLEDNPFLLAGWVGMLITGLNMMPISQLDGGHVIYALFGRRRAHRIAKGFLVFAILYIIFTDTTMWTMMLILVILIGPTHPPTADDTAELSLTQKLVGYASLAIPFLCFPPQGITFQ